MAATADHLVNIIQKAQLVPPGQLDQVKKLQKRFTTSRALAEELIRRNWLSAYQVNLILQGRVNDLVLGKHRLLEKLGEGGSGQVFKAFHETLNCVVAVKVLRKDVQSDADTVSRFYREMEVARRVSHANIVHAYEAGAVGSTLLLTMEYVDGIDLENLVRKTGPLPFSQACDYLRQAALGLQHAHDQGLVHRDVKPSNLLVTPKPQPRQTGFGVVKILDLGLARLLYPPQDSATRNITLLAGNSIMIGTPDYMAPEQALDLHSADTRADIYSLGCTFYFMLTGQPPYGGGSLTQKLMRHQQTEPPPATRLCRDTPPAADDLIRRMLSKKPKDRIQTAAEVAESAARLQMAEKVTTVATGPLVHPSSLGPVHPLKHLGGKLLRLPRKVYMSLGIVFLILMIWWSIPSAATDSAPGNSTTLATPTKNSTAPVGKTAPQSRTLVIQGPGVVRDAIIDPFLPDQNFGSEDSDNRVARRTMTSAFLVRFILKPHALATTNVKKATVSIYSWDPHASARMRVHVYQVKTYWDEANVSWQRSTAKKTWQKGTFTIGVDTGPPGARVIVQPYAKSDVLDPPVEYKLDVTAMVQAWVKREAPNYGMAIAGVIDRKIDDGLHSRFQIRASEYRRTRYTPKLTMVIEE